MEELLEQVGQYYQNENLVKGAITVGAAALTVLLTAWRVVFRKKSSERIIANINVPSGTQVHFTTGPELQAGKILPLVAHSSERQSNGEVKHRFTDR